MRDAASDDQPESKPPAADIKERMCSYLASLLGDADDRLPDRIATEDEQEREQIRRALRELRDEMMRRAGPYWPSLRPVKNQPGKFLDMVNGRLLVMEDYREESVAEHRVRQLKSLGYGDLLEAGRQLATCAFNLKQRDHLTDNERRSLAESQKRWDAALTVLSRKRSAGG